MQACELSEGLRDTIEKDAVTVADSLSHLLFSSSSSIRSTSPPLSRTASPIRRHSVSPLRKTRSCTSRTSNDPREHEQRLAVGVGPDPPRGRDSNSGTTRPSRRSCSPTPSGVKKTSTTESLASDLAQSTTTVISLGDSSGTTGFSTRGWTSAPGRCAEDARPQNAHTQRLENLLATTPPRSRTQGGSRAGRTPCKPLGEPVFSSFHGENGSPNTTPKKSSEGRRQTRTPCKTLEQGERPGRNPGSRNNELDTVQRELQMNRADEGNPSSLKRRGSRPRQSDGVWNAHTPRMTPRTRSAFRQVQQGIEALEICSSLSRRRRRVGEVPREDEADVKM